LSAGADAPGFTTPQIFAKGPDASNRAHLEDRNTGFVNWNASLHPNQYTRWMVTNPSSENYAKVGQPEFIFTITIIFHTGYEVSQEKIPSHR
jgi:hypothetical protein